jgi:hypothetical protein
MPRGPWGRMSPLVRWRFGAPRPPVGHDFGALPRMVRIRMEPSLAVLLWSISALACLGLAQIRGASNTTAWVVVGIVLGPLGFIAALLGMKRDPSRTRIRDPTERAVLRALTTKNFILIVAFWLVVLYLYFSSSVH